MRLASVLLEEEPALTIEPRGGFDTAEVPDARQDDQARRGYAVMQGAADLNR
jgi:hypothetical protein